MSDEPKLLKCPECGETSRTRTNGTNCWCKTCLSEWKLSDEPKREELEKRIEVLEDYVAKLYETQIKILTKLRDDFD